MKRSKKLSEIAGKILDCVNRADSNGIIDVLKASPGDAMDLYPGLIAALEKDCAECVEVILKLGGLNVEYLGETITPLGFALSNGSRNSTRTLCRLGADVNAIAHEASGKRPLHLAIELECMHTFRGEDGYDCEMTAFLLEHGADPLLTDRNGATALDFARFGGHLKAYLQMMGVANGYGPTALAEARSLAVEDTDSLRAMCDIPLAIELVDDEGVDTGFVLGVNPDGLVVLRENNFAIDRLWTLSFSTSPTGGLGEVNVTNIATVAGLHRSIHSELAQIELPPTLLRVGMVKLEDRALATWCFARLSRAHQKGTWSIFDTELTHCVSLRQFIPKEGIPVVVASWVGIAGQCWRLKVPDR